MSEAPPGLTTEPATPRCVLHVLNGAAGGAAQSTLQLITALRARGIASAAACHDAGSAEEMQALEDAVDGRLLVAHLWWWNRRTRVAAWKRPLLDARESWRTGRGRRSAARITAFAREHAVDLVHTNTILTPEGALVARALRVPHVWHIRELVGPGEPFRFWWEPRFFARRVAENCDVLIANSEATLERIGRWLPEDTAVVVPNGIDVTRFAAIAPPIGRQPPVVGMVANLTSRWKRHDLFIEAAGRVDRSVPVRFALAGHDPSGNGEADAYSALLHDRVTQLGLDDRFEFRGFVGDTPSLMGSLDVLVHPCERESFGRVALEAMAAGRPVVGADGGGLATIVLPGVTGSLVPPDDPDALARAITELATDETRRAEWGAAGRDLARQRFSLDATVDGVVRAYHTAAARAAY
jgi:glycosyltransferase involved in cell wall biosynthesis